MRRQPRFAHLSSGLILQAGVTATLQSRILMKTILSTLIILLRLCDIAKCRSISSVQRSKSPAMHLSSSSSILARSSRQQLASSRSTGQNLRMTNWVAQTLINSNLLNIPNQAKLWRCSIQLCPTKMTLAITAHLSSLRIVRCQRVKVTMAIECLNSIPNLLI